MSHILFILRYASKITPTYNKYITNRNIVSVIILIVIVIVFEKLTIII